MSLNDWEEGTEVPADKEGEDLKDLCAAIIEELWGRLDEEYKEGIAKGMEIKMDEFTYEISKGVVGRAAGK